MTDKHEMISEQQNAFLQKQRNRILWIRICRIVFIILFLLLWQLAANKKWIDSFFFSSPKDIMLSFLSGILDKTLFIHIGITLTETIVSFIIIILLSLSLASILWFYTALGNFIEPFLVVLNSLPKSALAPLIMVWFGTGSKTIILCGISVAIFGAILTLYHYFTEIDDEKIKLILTLGGTRIDAYKKIILPGSLPQLISLSKVNIGLCLVGVIIGEFLAGKKGLGYLIIYSSQVFKLQNVILSIVILCIIAMGLYQIIQFLEKRIL